MSGESSINFKKSISINTEHNDRTLPPAYLMSDRGCEYNHSAEYARQIKHQIITSAISTYTKNTGQKFQAKSYEWSAVCNIKPETTMQDLQNLATHLETHYGFQCYQIAIHRDEGHKNDEGELVANQHAHLELITLDKNSGKNRQRELSRVKLRILQTEVAQILGMQRGIDKRISHTQRIEPRKYAQMKEAERLKEKKLKIQYEERLNIIKSNLLEQKKQILALENLIKQLKEKKQKLLQESYQDLLNKINEIFLNMNIIENLSGELYPHIFRSSIYENAQKLGILQAVKKLFIPVNQMLKSNNNQILSLNEQLKNFKANECKFSDDYKILEFENAKLKFKILILENNIDEKQLKKYFEDFLQNESIPQTYDFNNEKNIVKFFKVVDMEKFNNFIKSQEPKTQNQNVRLEEQNYYYSYDEDEQTPSSDMKL